MFKQNKKIKNTFLVIGLIVATNIAYARPYPQSAEVYPNLPTNCDRNVMNQLFSNAEQRYQSLAPAANALLVKEQVQATPTAPTDALNKCLSGAMSAIKGITNGIDGLLGIFNGSTNPTDAAMNVAKQIGNAACNKIDGYITGGVYNSTSGVMGQVGQVTGMANNGVNVNTPIGGINVGGGLITPSKTTTVPGILK